MPSNDDHDFTTADSRTHSGRSPALGDNTVVRRLPGDWEVIEHHHLWARLSAGRIDRAILIVRLTAYRNSDAVASGDLIRHFGKTANEGIVSDGGRVPDVDAVNRQVVAQFTLVVPKSAELDRDIAE